MRNRISIDRSKFDQSLGSIFYQLPQQQLDNEPNFVIPYYDMRAGQEHHFADFLQGPEGDCFRTSVTDLVNRLKAWADSHGMTAANNPYAELIRSFHYSGRNTGYLNEIYPLYSEGVTALYHIVLQLESGKVTPNAQAVIQNLVNSFNKCGPGIFTNLGSARIALMADPSYEYMTIRLNIAREIALTLYQEYLEFDLENEKKKFIATLRHYAQHPQIYQNLINAHLAYHRNYQNLIAPGMEIHCVNAVLNRCHEALGIQYTEDAHTDTRIELCVNAIKYMADKLPAKLYPAITLRNIINSIMQNLATEKLMTEPSYGTKLAALLDRYGADSDFNIAKLYDEDAMADDRYVLVGNANNLIQTSLIKRLIQSNTINISNIQFSRVKNHASFVEYCLSTNQGLYEGINTALTNNLLTGNMNRNEQDANGQTLAHRLAILGEINWIKTLICEGVDFNRLDNRHFSPITHAALNNHVDVVEFLATQPGVDLNHRDSHGYTLLHYAAANNKVDVVRFLLNQPNIDLNILDSYNKTPLALATAHNHHEIATLIANKIAAANQPKLTLLAAAECGDVNTLIALIDNHDLDINCQNQDGRNALHLAVLHHHPEVIRILITKNGMKLNEKDHHGYSALHYATAQNKIQIVRLLATVEAVDFTLRDNFQQTPAAWAHDKPDMLQLINERIANPEHFRRERIAGARHRFLNNLEAGRPVAEGIRVAP